MEKYSGEECEDTCDNSNLRDGVHTIRKEISAALGNLAELQNVVGRGDGGRELALVKTKLEEAKMWGGKALGTLGELPPDNYAHDNA